MTLATSHLNAAHAFASGFFGGDVGVMRPHDVDFQTAPSTIAGTERMERRESPEGGVDFVKVRDVVISISLIPGEVVRGDLIWQIEGNRYATEDSMTVDGGFATFKVRRVESREIARKGYRGRR